MKINLQILKKIGKILNNILDYKIPNILQNNQYINTNILNNKIEKIILDNKCYAALKNFHPSFSKVKYKFATCISINDEMVHGEPNIKKWIKNNDIVKVDIVIGKKIKKHQKYLVDAARTYFYINNQNKINKKKYSYYNFVDKFYKNFFISIKNKKFIKLEELIQFWEHNFFLFRKKFYNIFHEEINLISNLTGHFINPNIHNYPYIFFITNYNKQHLFKVNSTFCFEPVLVIGKNKNTIKEGDFCIKSQSKKISFHYENTILYNKKNRLDILT